MSNINKKGKIFRGAAFSSLYKTNVSSIPSKSENFLIPDCNHQPQLEGFVSHSHRFEDNGPNNPGVGEYTIAVPDSAIFSSKGYGNGFISKIDRFNSGGSFIPFSSVPGPGEYNAEKVNTIQKNIDNSIFGRNMYSNNKTISFKENIEYPGPSTYNPMKYDNWKIRNKSYVYNFDSSPKERGENYCNSNPGPGEYFKTDPQMKHKIKIGKSQEVLKTNPSIERMKTLKKLSIRVGNENRKVAPKKTMTEGNRERKPKEKQELMRNEQKMLAIHFSPNNFYRKVPENNEREKDGSIPKIRFKIEQEKELEYVKQILGNDNGKPDLMFLASPRWKKSRVEFKPPGPAYYPTSHYQNKRSFNKNTKDFICPVGVEV